MYRYGKILQDRLGNNIVTTREFDINGYLSHILSYGSDLIQDNRSSLSQLFFFSFVFIIFGRYQMDSMGNVLTRYDEVHSNEEHITYNSLNQITRVDVNGQDVRTVEYDLLSNIVMKSGVGVSNIIPKTKENR